MKCPELDRFCRDKKTLTEIDKVLVHRPPIYNGFYPPKCVLYNELMVTIKSSKICRRYQYPVTSVKTNVKMAGNLITTSQFIANGIPHDAYMQA